MFPALLLALSFAVHAAPVAAPVTAPRADHPLVAAWADTPVAATWFFVVETAGASLPVAEAAREDIAQLIEALPAGDHVQVLALHTRTNLALGATVGDAAARADLAADVRALKLPSAKDSDLGAGLADVSARIGKTDPRSPRIVWMMASFCHSPSVSSAYADGGAGCRTIRGFEVLDKAFDGQPGGDAVDVALFPIAVGGQPPHGPGQATVERFFGPAASVRVAATSLAEWAAATRADLALTRVRPLAHAEAANLSLELSVLRGPTEESSEALLTLSTGLSHLSFRATRVEVAGGTTRLAALQLAPDGQLAVEVAVPPRTFSLFPAREPLALPVSVSVSGLLGPTEALRAAGIRPEHAELTSTVTLHVERSYGPSLAQSGGAATCALLLLGAGTRMLRRRRRARLDGTLTWRRSGGPRHTIAIEGLEEAAIGVLDDGRLGLVRPASAVLVLRIERAKTGNSARVEILRPDVEINRRPSRLGRHAIVPGATSFQFQDFRLNWE